jgi:hypothetical protein
VNAVARDTASLRAEEVLVLDRSADRGVHLGLASVVPPAVLFHGTAAASLPMGRSRLG